MKKLSSVADLNNLSVAFQGEVIASLVNEAASVFWNTTE